MSFKFFNKELLCLYIIYWISIAAGYSNDLQDSELERRDLLISESLPFEDCGSKYDVLFVGVSNCSGIPCQMARGSIVTVTVIFDDEGHQTSFLKHRVRWILNAIKTNAIITPDPCIGNDSCLNEEKEGKSYTAKVLVSTTLPNDKIFNCQSHFVEYILGKSEDFCSQLVDFCMTLGPTKNQLIGICMTLWLTRSQIRGTMMWEAVDQSNTEVICFKIPVVITASRSFY